ncbi:MAG: acetate/propionate family kinase [Polyangiaceae bacterium]|nr:acetate/propionate family kinase [Polyangiaceae bacterium]
MLILVLNCGSSSLRAAVVDHASGKRVARARVERIGEAGSEVAYDDDPAAKLVAKNHEEALAEVLPALIGRAGDAQLAGIGHRVVHGGERFTQPVRIDEDVERAIAELVPLAPLHNPANLAGIVAARRLLPALPHVAVFDTAFHGTLPPRARHYAVDAELAKKHGVRRYGFHGTSHAFVAARAAVHLDAPLSNLRLITCHLGNGASVCAIEYGRSVETSMGMTPLEGLVMGTRSGDLDVGAALHIGRAEGLDYDGLDTLLNKKSGLAGLSGAGNDLRDIEDRAAKGDERARLAIHVFCHRLRKYIGAYAAVLGGLDAIVFTGGIGQNSALVRHRVARNLQIFGAHLDEDANREARATAEKPVIRISTDTSRAHVLVVATDEEHAIAADTAKLVGGQDKVVSKRIPIAISARHIHLRQETVETLFGPGHKLTPLKDLSQPGQYACAEMLEVVGPKRSISGVRVLGPVRPVDQVEISRTDEFFLGVDAPVRDSGDVRGSPGIKLVGPHGSVTLEQGVICARRHIHMAPEDADHFGVSDGDVVEVAIDSEGRDLVFGDVLIRVSPKFCLEMHVDTDEANAAELKPKDEGALVATGALATPLRRVLR